MPDRIRPADRDRLTIATSDGPCRRSPRRQRPALGRDRKVPFRSRASMAGWNTEAIVNQMHAFRAEQALFTPGEMLVCGAK